MIKKESDACEQGKRQDTAYYMGADPRRDRDLLGAARHSLCLPRHHARLEGLRRGYDVCSRGLVHDSDVGGADDTDGGAQPQGQGQAPELSAAAGHRDRFVRGIHVLFGAALLSLSRNNYSSLVSMRIFLYA